jgi:hypothetical protein
MLQPLCSAIKISTINNAVAISGHCAQLAEDMIAVTAFVRCAPNQGQSHHRRQLPLVMTAEASPVILAELIVDRSSSSA